MRLKRKHLFIIKIIMSLIGIGLLLAVYVRYSWQAGYNSDTAATFIMTREILKGNYFLKGWIGATISGLTTWYIPDGLIMLFTGAGQCGREIIYIIPAVIYLFTFIMSLLIVRSYKEKPKLWIAMLLTVMGLPATRLCFCFFRIAVHMETINYLLLLMFLWTIKSKKLSGGVFMLYVQ